MGYTPTRCVIKWWNPETNTINLSTGAKFNELKFLDKDGKLAPGCALHSNIENINIDDIPEEKVDTTDHPFFDSPPEKIMVTLPPSGEQLGLVLEYCEYTNMTYIVKTKISSYMYPPFGTKTSLATSREYIQALKNSRYLHTLTWPAAVFWFVSHPSRGILGSPTNAS